MGVDEWKGGRMGGRLEGLRRTWTEVRRVVGRGGFADEWLVGLEVR